MKEQIIHILQTYISTIQMCNDDDPIEIVGIDAAADEIIGIADKMVSEIAKDAWFEGMKQGIKFDREDRQIKTIMETEPRVSFEEWFRSRMKGEGK